MKAGRQTAYAVQDVPKMPSPQLRPLKWGDMTSERYVHPGMRGSVSARIMQAVDKRGCATPPAMCTCQRRCSMRRTHLTC
jgi:hypothetical protein